MKHATTYNEAAGDTQDEAVKLWRRAIQGDAEARRAFQRPSRPEQAPRGERVTLVLAPPPEEQELAMAGAV